MIEPFKMGYTAIGGLGIFILGMKYLSDSLQSLSGGMIRKAISSVTTNRFLAVLVGLFVTTFVQSSSITTVMVVGLTNAGLMQLTQAIGVILGANIGTTITAQFASIGGSIASRRAAMAHSVFNVLGVVIIISIFSPYVNMIEEFVPGLSGFIDAEGNRPYVAAHIAMAHTFFNVTATLVMLPFLNQLARLVTRLVPEKAGAEKGSFKYIGSPGTMPVAMGITMVFEELKRMQNRVHKILRHADSFLHRDLKGRDRFYRKVKELEDETDIMQHEITSFTVTLMQSGGASKDQSDRAYSYVRAADELESIADYAASLCSYMRRLEKHELDYTEDGWKDLHNFHHEVFTFFTQVCRAFNNEDVSSTRKIYDEANRLNDLADEVRNGHLARMKEGTCGALPALTFSDMAVALRRIKNHTVNLHEALFPEK